MKRYLLLAAGVVGLIELLVPRAAVRLFTRIAYRNAGAAESRGWLHTATRLEGALLVALALVGLFKVAGSDEGGESGEDASDSPNGN